MSSLEYLAVSPALERQQQAFQHASEILETHQQTRKLLSAEKQKDAQTTIDQLSVGNSDHFALIRDITKLIVRKIGRAHV